MAALPIATIAATMRALPVAAMPVPPVALVVLAPVVALMPPVVAVGALVAVVAVVAVAALVRGVVVVVLGQAVVALLALRVVVLPALHDQGIRREKCTFFNLVSRLADSRLTFPLIMFSCYPVFPLSLPLLIPFSLPPFDYS